MFTSVHNRALLALAVGTLAFQAPVHAAAFGGASPVSMQALDQIRGGFGFEINLGQMMLAMNMSQVSMINGVVVPGEQTVTSAGGGSTLIQLGPHNWINPSVLNNIPAGSMSTVIQNSLNDQAIQSINTLNITITSQALAQNMALQSFAQGALLRFQH